MKIIYLSFILSFLFIIGCDKIPDSQIDPQNTTLQAAGINAPSDFKFSIFDSSFTTYVKFDSVANLKSVWVDIYSPLDEKINSDPIFLKDDGNFSAGGDSAKDDKKYSGKITLGKSNISGVYQLKYYASDISDNTQQLGIHTVTYRSTDQNNAPLISDLSVPDSVKLSNDTLGIFIRLKAIDKDGQDDIKLVYFNSYKPDGQPSKSNPTLMFDDGNFENDGDDVAGDSIFTRIIILPPKTPTGTYKFEFHAIDRFDAESNVIIHNIVVY